MAAQKIGALWVRKSKDGKMTYMSGVIKDFHGEIQIAVFKNEKKQIGTKQPDYNIVLSGNKPRQKAAEAPPSSGEDLPF